MGLKLRYNYDNRLFRKKNDVSFIRPSSNRRIFSWDIFQPLNLIIPSYHKNVIYSEYSSYSLSPLEPWLWNITFAYNTHIHFERWVHAKVIFHVAAFPQLQVCIYYFYFILYIYSLSPLSPKGARNFIRLMQYTFWKLLSFYAKSNNPTRAFKSAGKNFMQIERKCTDPRLLRANSFSLDRSWFKWFLSCLSFLCTKFLLINS